MENMMIYILIAFLSFDIIIYVFSFYLVWRKKEFQEISVRSPFLLTMNNIGGFLMTFTYIMYEILEKTTNEDKMLIFCETLPYNYIVFHMLMILSFYLRCHRIIVCCNITRNDNDEEFIKNRDIFTEHYYVKVLFISMIVITIASYFINYYLSKELTDIIILPKHFEKCIKLTDNNNALLLNFSLIFWIILNFIECFILITYTYFIYYSQINKSIKFELFSFLFLWISNSNFLRVLDLFFNVNNNEENIHIGFLIFVILLMLCLVTNTYIPIIYSYFQNSNLNLHFSTKLVNNFFLFMSNEYCFNEFILFLKSQRDPIVLQYLDFYIDIITLKIKLNLKKDNYLFLKDIKRIYDSINKNDDLFTIEIKTKIDSYYHNYDKNLIGIELFDEALCFTYELLENKFAEFKVTEKYYNLVNKIKFQSDIFCRMYNTGLIRKI